VLDVSLLPQAMPQIQRIRFLNLVECSSLPFSLPDLPGCSHDANGMEEA